ncbi:MAG: DUF3784 domain-containing protein [Limnochordia bacterium]|jgi:hypothetical protein|nr:DUF3784 domain-containing protein [Limnochordia bacterium]
MMLLLVWLLTGVFLVFVGLSVHVFKWYFLISGYNTMPQDQKANVDIASVARLIGFWGYVNGGVCIVLGIMSAFGVDPTAGLIPALILFGVSTTYLLIRAQRYGFNTKSRRGGRVRSGRIHQYGSIGATIVALIVVGLMMLYFIQHTKITIDDDGIVIHGLYGGTYSWETIASADLVEELPRLTRRTNGAAIGSRLRGHFRTAEGDSIKLFVDRNQPPFIHLIGDNQIIYFNLKTPDDTRQAFDAIFERLQP